MASILSQAMTRLADMQIEALAGVTIDGAAVTADAVAYFPYEQEGFPYWTNRITAHTRTWEADDIAIDTYTIVSRLVVNHLTAGYLGENVSDLYEYIPAWLDFLDDNRFLTSANYTSKLNNIMPIDVTTLSSTGVNAFANSGIGAIQIGTDFTLELPLLKSVY